MPGVKLDHVAIGLWRWEDAVELFEERLGGARSGGHDGVPFGFRQWEFAGGGRLEIVYPAGPPDGFLHPKRAQGIVVQMVEQRPREGGEDWPAARPRSDAAQIRGLRLSAKSAEAARSQWGELLGGSGFIQGDALIFRWEESPLVLLVDVDPDRDEGPLQLELSAARDLGLPDGSYPGFGTRFLQV